MPSHILTLHGSWMHEQTWNTTALVGTAISNARDRLDRLSLGARYFYDRTYGFYSLGMFTLALDSIPAELARTLPRYEAIPAALIGRLARHTRVDTGASVRRAVCRET